MRNFGRGISVVFEAGVGNLNTTQQLPFKLTLHYVYSVIDFTLMTQ